MTEDQPKKMQTRLPFFFATAMAVGMFIGWQLPRYDRDVRFESNMNANSSGVNGTMDEVLRYIEAKYVDSVDISTLKAGAINHLLEGLDPHSVYISPDEMDAVEEDMKGKFEGIGIEFLIVEDTIQVVAPLSGGPSEAAGILAGDKLITIADTTVAGVKIENGKIFKMLRGDKGTQVKIGVLRGKEKSLRQFTIIRDVIPVHSVDIAYMLDDITGYIKVNRFSSETYREFMEGIRPLVEKNGMKNLVLDLRGNPGGYLNEATDLLSQFFTEGKLLVYTKGRTESRKDYKSNGRARFVIDNIAVLIDEGSASASEIVAGAIQDHDRGWIIGRRSFGKGLVQEQYPLEDGGGLRLTVARYYTPSGRCIQRDYKHTKDYDDESEKRLKSGELSDVSKMKVVDSTKYYTGLGRIVYSGGGVTPDFFIPLDTSYANNYFFDVRQILPEFVAKWMEINGKSSFPTSLNAFVQNYQVTDAMMEQLVAHAEKSKIKLNPAQYAKSKEELSHELKARIAKVLFQQEGLFAVLNNDDPAIDKAKQLLRSGQKISNK